MGVPLPLHPFRWFQMFLNDSVELCHVHRAASFLTVKEHSGETAKTDVQGCTNLRQQVTKFCVVAPNISMELAL